MTSSLARRLPRNTQTRMQYLLDQGDERYFADHPGETQRRRFYFLGEKITDGGEAARFVVVRMENGQLVRRFAAGEAGER